MQFLIDGYNLMHAIGMASRTMPAKAFERSRERFLDWLAEAAGTRALSVRVVFDAREAPIPSTEYKHGGLRVHFAYGRTADEAIEEMIARERRPDKLTVVSNDNQVQEDARRRKCGVMECQAFIDWLQSNRGDSVSGTPEPEKPVPTASDTEMAAWLAAFSRPRGR